MDCTLTLHWTGNIYFSVREQPCIMRLLVNSYSSETVSGDTVRSTRSVRWGSQSESWDEGREIKEGLIGRGLAVMSLMPGELPLNYLRFCHPNPVSNPKSSNASIDFKTSSNKYVSVMPVSFKGTRWLGSTIYL